MNNYLTLLASCKVSVAYELSIKDLELRIIFELFLKDYDYHALLFAKIKSFEYYLRGSATKTFVASKATLYLNYLKILRALAKRLVTKKAPLYIRKHFLPQLTESSNMVGKQWLLEKIEGLSTYANIS